MEQDISDVIIVGAGAAGLMAAWELVQAGKTVTVLEARDRTGGRVHTFPDENFALPVELGAEFIHGKLDPTLQLLKRAGIGYYEVTGEIWQNEEGHLSEQEDFIEDYSALRKKFRELKQDIAVDEFFRIHLRGQEFEEARFTLKNYVEGYNAADLKRASTFALREDLSGSEEDQYRVEGGYKMILSYLEEECRKKGARFFLSHPVQAIDWKEDQVEVMANGTSFRSVKILVTVPMGVLLSEAIRFTPSLPHKTDAARRLGFGPVVKTVLQFREAFWKNKKHTQDKDLHKLSFIFAKTTIPTWWTYYPKDAAMITGWSGGPNAQRIKDLSNEEILEKAIRSLSQIFSLERDFLRKELKGWHVANWATDPYSIGGYSYEVVNGAAAKSILKQPEKNTLFFSGEGLMEGPQIGTVNAAFFMGRETGRQVIAAFKK